MLSLFPNLFEYSFLAPTILRLVLSFSLFKIATEIFTKKSYLIQFLKSKKTILPKFWVLFFVFLFDITAFGILFGFFAQGFAIIAATLLLILAIIESGNKHLLLEKNPSEYIVLFMISCAILILGAGAFAFDLYL